MTSARPRARRTKLSLKAKRRIMTFLCTLITVLVLLIVLASVLSRGNVERAWDVEGFQRNILFGAYHSDPQKAEKLTQYLQNTRNFGYWGNKSDLLNCVYYDNKIWFTAVDFYPNLLPGEFQYMDASSVFVFESETAVPIRFFDDMLELLRGNPIPAGVRQPLVATAAAASENAPGPDITVYVPSIGLRSFFLSFESYKEGILPKALKDAGRRLTVVTGASDHYLSRFDYDYTKSHFAVKKVEEVSIYRFLEQPWLHMIYSQNCDVAHEKVVCVPIGIDFHSLVGDYFRTLGYTQQTAHLLKRQLALMRGDKRFVMYGSPKEERLASGATLSVETQTEAQIQETLRDKKKVYVLDAEERHIARNAGDEDGDEVRTGTGRSGQKSALSFLKEHQPKEVVLLVPRLDPRPARKGNHARSVVVEQLRTKPLYVGTDTSGHCSVYVPLYTFFQHFAEFTFGHPSRENKLLVAFGLTTFRQRYVARRQAMRSKLGFLFQAKSMDAYYDALARYAFIVSPIGVGYDCHRTWDALLMGCIPIVQHPRAFLDKQPLDANASLQLFEDLPVFVVDDYSTITVDQLNRWKEEVQRKTRRGEYKFEKLFSQYWIDQVFAAP